MVVITLPPPESGLPEGVKALGLMAITIVTFQKEVGEAVWGKHVPSALADGGLEAKPDAIVTRKELRWFRRGWVSRRRMCRLGRL
jgi:hypothetical protein